MIVLYVYDCVMIICCITFLSLNKINSGTAVKKQNIVCGYVISIVSVITGLLQQFLSFIIGLFIVSFSDGNSLTNDAERTILLLLLLPVVMIISAILCILRAKKLSDRTKQ